MMPISPSAPARSGYSPSRPMCIELRNVAVAMPCSRAACIAHWSATIVEYWPNDFSASTSAVAPRPRTTPGCGGGRLVVGLGRSRVVARVGGCGDEVHSRGLGTAARCLAGMLLVDREPSPVPQTAGRCGELSVGGRGGAIPLGRALTVSPVLG